MHSPRSSKGRRKSSGPKNLVQLSQSQSKTTSRFFPGGNNDDGGVLSPACPEQLDSPSLTQTQSRSPTSLNPDAVAFVPGKKKDLGKPPTPKKTRGGGGSSPQKTRSRPGTPMRQHEASVSAGVSKSEARLRNSLRPTSSDKNMTHCVIAGRHGRRGLQLVGGDRDRGSPVGHSICHV